MNLNILVRKIHLYAGLQATIGLLIFAVSVMVATVHSEADWEISHQRYTGAIVEDDLELARAMHDELGRPFEKVPQRWMVASEDSGLLRVRYYSPNGWRELRLDRASRDVEVKAKPLGLAGFLNLIHQESVGRRDLSDSLWLWAWALYIEISILSLFALPVTGLYIWLTSKPDQRYAQLSFALSCGAMLTLWILVR